jgi:hypothetical protein
LRNAARMTPFPTRAQLPTHRMRSPHWEDGRRKSQRCWPSAKTSWFRAGNRRLQVPGTRGKNPEEGAAYGCFSTLPETPSRCRHRPVRCLPWWSLLLR